MKYWQERQQQLNDQLTKDEDRLKAKLSNIYDIEQKRLEKEIASYYQTYGENNVIEYRNLMENLPYEDKQLLLQRMDEFAEMYPQYAHLMPVRESIYKLNRLEGLQTSIKMQQLEIGAIDNAELQSHLEQLALRSANSSAEMLGFGKNFYTVNSDLVAKTVGKQWADGKNFSERIWSNRSKLADYLNNDFAMAIARGDSYQRCIKALGDRFAKVSRNDIYRLVYTEGTFVQNEASITPFEEDFEEYQISIADKNACKHCKAMQDKKFSIKDRKAGVNFPPFHSWCRCSFTIAVDDWDKWMDDYVEKHGKEPENAVKSVAKSDESGIIKTEEYKDNDTVYKPVTDSSIENVPLMKVFTADDISNVETQKQADVLNEKYREASKNLLKEVQKHPVGTEVSIVYDENMNPIKDYGYIVGGIGSVKIENPSVLYHAFHNHASGGIFSFQDLIGFARKDRMLSLSACGNNGNLYCISRTSKSDAKEYRDFLIHKKQEKKFSYNGSLYSYDDIVGNKINISSLNEKQIDRLKREINVFSLECIKGGEKFGFKYSFKTS